MNYFGLTLVIDGGSIIGLILWVIVIAIVIGVAIWILSAIGEVLGGVKDLVSKPKSSDSGHEVDYDQVIKFMKNKKRFNVFDVKKRVGLSLIETRKVMDNIQARGVIKPESAVSLYMIYIEEK